MNRYLERFFDNWYCAKYRRWKKHQGKQERENILVICRRPLGDTLLCTPFFRELKRNRPDVDIDVICSPQNYNLLEKSPYIHQFFLFDDRVKKHYYIVNLKRCWKLAIETLQSRHYREAYVPSTYMSSMIDGWLAYFSGAEHRTAFSETMNPSAHRQYGGHYDRLFTKILDVEEPRHDVVCNLDILRSCGMEVQQDDCEMWIAEEDRAVVEKLWRAEQIPEHTVKVLVNLSTSITSKDWPVENYIAVCQRLQVRYPVTWILIGAGARAAEYSKRFCQAIPAAHDFTNQTSIRQTMDIIERSDIYLGGDTGPMHMAAAAGLKGVAIYKTAKNCTDMVYNFPVRLYPWKAGIEILQPEKAIPGCEKNCEGKGAHCIKLNTVEQVYEAMDDVMQQWNGSTSDECRGTERAYDA